MGVGYLGLQIALLARRRGVDYARTASLARQCHYLDVRSLRAMFARFNLRLDEEEAAELLKDPYFEAIFRRLGAKVIDNIDASDYEGAEIIHDFNRPIDPSLHSKYSAVLDFGTLEHVFHFPNAIKSITDLLEVGGHFVSMTVANNFMGHGFYQFSPELFFSYLTANGFDDVEVYLAPYREFPYFFRATEPRRFGGRIELVNPEPIQMGIIARKVKHVPEAVIPIQSDYEQAFWRGRDVSRRERRAALDPKLEGAMADYRNRVTALLHWPESISPELVQGFENKLQYRLVDPAKE